MIATTDARHGHRTAAVTTSNEARSDPGAEPSPSAVATAPVPVAWYGRVAAAEEADLMLTRQLGAAQRAVSPKYTVVATFYDIGSGLLTPQERDRCIPHGAVELSLPRDGGLAALLAEAQRPDRRFVAVVCESIDRLARPSYLATTIAHELEQTGVTLLVADEGIDPSANHSLNDAADTAGRGSVSKGHPS
jgi:hypothetical protein